MVVWLLGYVVVWLCAVVWLCGCCGMVLYLVVWYGWWRCGVIGGGGVVGVVCNLPHQIKSHHHLMLHDTTWHYTTLLILDEMN